MSSTVYDYIIVGGGLCGCVLASRMREYDEALKILLIEVGPDTRSRTDILAMQSLNLGSDLEWKYETEPIPGISNRVVNISQGKGLGGGTAINSGAWTRGAATDYDEWAAVVGDQRWSYQGQLPWMKKSESWYHDKNPKQHGNDGPTHVATFRSTGRKYPLSEAQAAAWDELGVAALPELDQNAGNNVGRAEFGEGRRNGQRQLAATIYPLDGVTVLTETLVKKVILNTDTSNDNVKASGVELADGTIVHSENVILSAGTFRSPQVLMLSGIGPSAHLAEHGIQTLVDLPDVGQNLCDHMSLYQNWRLRDPEAGYTMGSSNPLLAQLEFGLGVPMDWIVCSDVPKAGLAAAIEKDAGGAKPDWEEHRLLRQPRAMYEAIVLYAKMPVPGLEADTEHLTTILVSFLPTSRGSVTLRSADPEDTLRVNPNYLATEVDRYVYREAVRQLTRLMHDTKFGRDHILGESVPEGIEAVGPDGDDDDDDKLDRRLAQCSSTMWHPTGTCAMGSVIDSEFRVRGVRGLRVVDASVFPVPLSAHLQAPLYAMSEQAAAIFAGKA
ncbi:GMC oxidoreductase-domain-containing protein [Xylariales sp. PMI_506]|nr:GMC oxidoreductase-domain-containing protein [Xylariales sp. PMI_506]